MDTTRYAVRRLVCRAFSRCIVMLAAGLILAVGGAGSARAQHSQKPGFGVAPPTATAIALTPINMSSGKLQLTFQPDPRLTKTLPINVGDKSVKLKLQPGSNPPSYIGKIPFDFVTFEQEQSMRETANEDGDTVSIFQVRELQSTEPLPFIDPALIEKAVADKSVLNFTPGGNPGGPATIVPNQELFVNDPSVVGDPTRTWDPCTGAGNPTGAWTFGTLMTAMANQPLTGVNPSTFVLNWLNNWASPQIVNGWTVPARPAIASLIAAWPLNGNGQLDLTQSPLKLVAIVNRLDLRTNSVYGGGSAGEGRFIFQWVQPGNSCSSGISFTVILEYGVPLSGCSAVHNWAAQWHALGALPFPSSAYNTALQAITDVFALANANPAKENGSALDQLRTDEVALAFPWQLRQFSLESVPNGLPADNMLNEAEVSQTPENSFDFTQEFTNYLMTVPPPPGFYQVPLLFPSPSTGMLEPFLGAYSDNNQQTWDGNPSVPTDTRNEVSMSTCPGCHGVDTGTSFLQASLAGLSEFLTGASPFTVANPGTYMVMDPVSGVQRTYGDLLRREVDLQGLLGQSCFGGGFLTDMDLFPINSAD